ETLDGTSPSPFAMEIGPPTKPYDGVSNMDVTRYVDHDRRHGGLMDARVRKFGPDVLRVSELLRTLPLSSEDRRSVKAAVGEILWEGYFRFGDGKLPESVLRGMDGTELGRVLRGGE
ncbi:MAG: hypothetical protein KC416_15260, partial [Myxococcales bacterium]|nr:hypothetical protein [Myxococcales bacterium]